MNWAPLVTVAGSGRGGRYAVSWWLVRRRQAPLQLCYQPRIPLGLRPLLSEASTIVVGQQSPTAKASALCESNQNQFIGPKKISGRQGIQFRRTKKKSFICFFCRCAITFWAEMECVVPGRSVRMFAKVI